MVATTQIVPFATGSGANVITPTEYIGSSAQIDGFSSGLAPSAIFNEAIRQPAFIAAGLANFCVNMGISVPDDGNLTNLVNELTEAFAAFIHLTTGYTEVTVATNVAAAATNTLYVGSAALTVNIPLSTTLTTNYNTAIFAYGGNIIIAPNASDKINGGSAGASVTVPKGLAAWVSTDANGNLFIYPKLGTAALLTASSSNAGGSVGTVYAYAGNPNGNVAGVAAVPGTSSSDFCIDTVHSQFYMCTVTGNAAAAVWTDVSGSGTIFTGGTSTGTANAQVVNPVTPSSFTLTAGYTVLWTAGYTNTAATQLNVATTGLVTVEKNTGSGLAALTGGEIVLGGLYSATYNGTVWVLNTATFGSLAYLNIGAGLRNDGAGNLQADDPVNTPDLSGNTVLNAASHRKTFIASASINLTLPHSTDVWNGWEVDVIAQGGSITVIPNASDAINNGAAGANLTLQQGTSCKIRTDGAGNVYVFFISGSPAVPAVLVIVNLIGVYVAAKQCQHTCDQINCSVGLGGATYQGNSKTFNFNGGTVGINGMDTGAFPNSGYLHHYAAYNPTTNTWGCFATTAGTGQKCYPGANAPAGFIATCLIASFVIVGNAFAPNFEQAGPLISIPFVRVLDATAAAVGGTYQALNLASCVPPNAIFVHGTAGTSTNNNNVPVFCLSASLYGIGAKRCVLQNATGNNSSIDGLLAAHDFEKLRIVPGSQQLFWKASDTAQRATIDITAYELPA